MDFSAVEINSYDKYTFGKCIKQQREELGMSLRKVATTIGISAAYLSDIEKGNRYAPLNERNIKIMYKLFEVLGIEENQQDYLIDMAYTTHGYPKDIVEYLSKCEKARKFMRRASELKLSDSDWECLLGQLETKEKKSVLVKRRK